MILALSTFIQFNIFVLVQVDLVDGYVIDDPALLPGVFRVSTVNEIQFSFWCFLAAMFLSAKTHFNNN